MAERTLIVKFGGTSVGNAQAMAQTIAIVQTARQEWPRVVAVSSALSGVTNKLLKSATQAALGEATFFQATGEELRARHSALAAALIDDPAARQAVLAELERLIDQFEALCKAILVLGEATPRALDAVASLGERMSVRVLAAGLVAAGAPAQPVDASEVIVSDDRFQAAHPDLEATTARIALRLLPLLEDGIIPVVTGFMAATPDGVITTLGRGGSDYSAAILGVTLQAADVWIWTDVDGVMTTDPRLAPARSIPELSYREVAELAYYGAKVLHPKTIRPVIEAGIGLRVANTFNPTHPGTRILGEQVAGQGQIKAVTLIGGQSLITIEGRGMLGVPGVAARTFGAVATTGTSVPLISQASSEQSICFAVPFEAAAAVTAALVAAFAAELNRRDIDRVVASPEVALLTVVGSGMRNTPGIAGKIFTALGERGVNVIAIAQGSSEVSISLVVDAQDAETAVQAVHTLIIHEGGAS